MTVIGEDGKTRDEIYNSLSELDKEWEDELEKPKRPWYLNVLGRPIEMVFSADDFRQDLKAIGNNFETEEEAKRAVEKLKAWQRLRDKGFRFDGYDVAHNSNGDLCGQLFYNAGDYCIEDVEKDLDLLFGGEK